MSTTRQLARRFAEAALTQAGLPLLPVVDERILGSALGATVSDGAELREEGRLSLSPTGPLVSVDCRLPPERQRFVICHELGHLLLAFPSLVMETVDVDLSRVSEEYLCDKIAGAMLMPHDWLYARYRCSEPSLDVVFDLAKEAAVSLSAAIVRLRDVVGWQVSLIQWVRENQSWVIDGEAGLLPQQQGLLRTTEDTQWFFGQTVTAQPARNDLKVEFAGRPLARVCEYAVHGSRAVALLRLPYVRGQPLHGRVQTSAGRSRFAA